jgi:uncharacterized membrane protein YhdT
MLLASTFMLAQAQTTYNEPVFFKPIFLALLVAGVLGWLIAAVLGFARARAFGASTRWFALACVCLILHHLQFLVIAIFIINDPDMVLNIGAFFNLFVVLAAVCAILGFVRLTNPR